MDEIFGAESSNAQGQKEFRNSEDCIKTPDLAKLEKLASLMCLRLNCIHKSNERPMPKWKKDINTKTPEVNWEH